MTWQAVNTCLTLGVSWRSRYREVYSPVFLAIRRSNHDGHRRRPINANSVDDRRSLGRIEIPYRIYHPE
jgi:hypothetical protein